MAELHKLFMRAFSKLVEGPEQGSDDTKVVQIVLHHDKIRLLILSASLALIMLCGFLFSVTKNELPLFVILALALLVYRCLDEALSKSDAPFSHRQLYQETDQDPAHIDTKQHHTKTAAHVAP